MSDRARHIAILARVTRSDGASVPDDHVIVLFGALGDLSKRKLLPGLFHLDRAGLMPANYRIIGTSRKGGTAEDFREVAEKAIGSAAGETFERFAERLEFSAFSAEDPSPLVDAVAKAEKELGDSPRRLYYLSIPPNAFGATVAALGELGPLGPLARGAREAVRRRPRERAVALNKLVHGVFDEERVFRIDHFLGREAIQNLIALRFANGMFEPIWNKDHIDHVQIDVPETLAVDDRAGFYEETGAYRDMVVTHLFHVLGFVAMEPPTALDGRSIVEETGKVFRSVKPISPNCVIRGQYAGYREGKGVDADSQTETFIAMRAEIDNWRWSGVPFFLRTGKRMGESAAAADDRLPRAAAADVPGGGRVRRGLRPGPHLLRLRRPGQDHDLVPGQGPGPEDAARPGADGVHLRAVLRDPGARALRAADVRRHARRPHAVHRLGGHRAPVGGVGGPARDPPPLHRYAPGSYGPQKMHELIAPRRWWLPETLAADDDDPALLVELDALDQRRRRERESSSCAPDDRVVADESTRAAGRTEQSATGCTRRTRVDDLAADQAMRLNVSAARPRGRRRALYCSARTRRRSGGRSQGR